ncbi:MAG: hypothetical protein IK099_14700 [Clostridia bacterium]|nr:hypothetical protein [Clostridia bacterium]
MNKECEIARDLMPLVLDEVASGGSKTLVYDHVVGCAECAAYMDKLKNDMPAPDESRQEEEKQAFAQATEKLKKKKRQRVLRSVLLGALAACVLLIAGYFGYWQITGLKSQIPLDAYDISLARLEDGSIVVTADYHGSRTPLYATSFFEDLIGDKRGVTEYIGMEKYWISHEMEYPMQNGSPISFSADYLERHSIQEIRQGTPKDYRTVWKKGDSIPAASPEMEEFYFWLGEWDRMYDRLSETTDEVIRFGSEAIQTRFMLLRQAIEAAESIVPEWQPWVGMDVKPLDENTRKWLLDGAEE